MCFTVEIYRPFSWHIVYVLCQELDEEIIVFIFLMNTSDGGRNVEVGHYR